jgi:hypothetical protein
MGNGNTATIRTSNEGNPGKPIKDVRSRHSKEMRVITAILVSHEIHQEDAPDTNNKPPLYKKGDLVKGGKVDVESIDIFNGRKTGHSIASIYFTDHSCETILAEYYEGEGKGTIVEKGSDLIELTYTDEDGNTITVQEGGKVKPRMIKEYWKQCNHVSYLIKCANSQIC